MRVIQKGNIDRYQNRFHCEKCFCIFEYEKKELRYAAGFFNGEYYEVECPECGHVKVVAAELVK